MPTHEDKVKINARVPKSLYDWIGSEYGNVSQAVNEGLELLKESKAEDCDTNSPQNSPQNGDVVAPLKESRSGDCDTNSSQKPTSQTEELKAALETLKTAEQARIEDMKVQVQALYDQLHIKDEQIEKLNENVHTQAVHIQTLIQENSRLNVKLLPETTGSKKSWWKFW